MTFLESYAKVITKSPCMVFWVMLVLSCVLSAIPYMFSNYELDFSTDGFEVKGNAVADTLALSYALNRLVTTTPGDDDNTWRRRQRGLASYTANINVCPEGDDYLISTFFRTRDDSNILTAANIAKAKTMQDAIKALPQTQGIYMSTISALSNKPKDEFDRILGVIASGVSSGLVEDFAGGAEYFYGNCNSTEFDWVRPGKFLCSEEWFSNTALEMHKKSFTDYYSKLVEDEEDMPDWREWYQEVAGEIDDVDSGIRSYFQRNFSSCHPSSSLVRVIVHACGQDNNEEQQLMYDSWRKIAKMEDDVVLSWSDWGYFNYEQEQEILGDAILIIAVAPLVFVAICVQTGSFFIAAMGFLEILLSFGLANFFYNIVLSIEYFHFLNFLGVFILFGIGADDVFVITDAWKQSRIIHGDLQLEKRMQATLKRAGPAILATSATTAAAFFGNIISSIPPLRLFGMITGFMVIFDWLLTVTFFASVLVIHAKYFTPKTKQEENEQEQEQDDGDIPIATNTVPVAAANNIEDEKSIEKGDSTGKGEEEFDVSSGSTGNKGEWRWLEDFFEKTYAPWLVRNATTILIFATVIVGIAANIAVGLEPLIEEPTIFPPGHNQYHIHNINQNVLPVGEYPTTLQVFYGVKNGDGSNNLDPATSEQGTVTFDDDFDLSAPQAQQFLLDTCVALSSDQNLVRSILDCFMFQFRDYARDRYSGGSFPDGCDDHERKKDDDDDTAAITKKGIGFPVPAEKFANAMQCFDQSNYKTSYDGMYGFDADGNVQWAVIQVLARLQDSAPVAQIQKAYGDWNAFIDARNTLGESVGGLGKALFLDQSYIFITLSTITELQSGFVKATALSLTLAFIVIIISTRNILLALFAAISVFSIVLCMVALMVLMGYKLGVLESLALSILVGISIDYTLHIALAYIDTPEKLSAGDRMTLACRHAGISVISGAITTSLSGLVLVFSTITFFSTFGLFILGTALLSIVSALTIFTSMCVLFLRKKNHDGDDESESSNESTSGGSGFPVRTCIALVFVFAASVASMVFLVTNDVKSVSPSSEIKTMDFIFPPHVISEKQTHYLCSSFVLPKSIYVNSIEVIDGVGLPSIVHHLLVLSSFQDYGTCPFQCMDMPDVTGLYWAWAIGGANLTLDSDQYMAFQDVVVVQIHYDNYLNRPISDAGSGVRVHYTEIEPTSSFSAVIDNENNAVSAVQVTTVGVGSLPDGDWEIPPNTQNNTIMFETRIQLVKEVSVRAWSLHMHETGVRGRLEIYRNDQFVSLLGCMGYKDVYGIDSTGIHGCVPSKYIFDYQRMIRVPRQSDGNNTNSSAVGGVIIKPGDVLRQTCEMDTSNLNEATKSGYATNEEMCQTFLSIYPSENLLSPDTFSFEATLLISDGNILEDRRSLAA